MMTTDPSSGVGIMLRLSKTFSAPVQQVFDAWTTPVNLRKWWGVADGYQTPIAEVDLRVGGRYRLGMQPPGSAEMHIVGGEFREVDPPNRLVYTWAWEMPDTGDDSESTLVTLEFNEHSDGTELVLTHERFPDEATRDIHQQGWSSMLERLGPALEGM